MSSPAGDLRNCPFCGASVIRGSDACDACGRELGAVDLPPLATGADDTGFSVSVSNIRVSRARAVTPDTTVADAIAAVTAEASGGIVVVEDGRLAGVFTDRDVLKRVAGVEGALERPVREFMTPDPVVVREDDTMAVVLNKMGAGGFRHVPLARDGEPVAMVTARDVLQWVMTCYFDDSV
jgi:CBS domain-containing protein